MNAIEQPVARSLYAESWLIVWSSCWLALLFAGIIALFVFGWPWLVAVALPVFVISQGIAIAVAFRFRCPACQRRLLVQGLCWADVTKLAPEDRRVLENTFRFHEVHSTRDLPFAVVALCGGGKIAEPGQKWNATDAIIDPTLPGKRLIWAAGGGDYYIVHYERGGIAHSYHILVAKLPNNAAKPKLVWTAMGGPFKNYAAFLDALRSAKLDGRLDYVH